ADRVRRLRDAAAHQRQKGLTCDWLDADEVTARWPGISPDALGALLAPEDGAVDPPALTRALSADGIAHGVQVVREQVVGISIAAGRVTGVIVKSGPRPAGAVVLAAGAWTPALTGLPRSIRVEPVRGQMALAAWPSKTPPAILYYNHAYVLARGGKAILGSTMERTGFDCRVTDAGLAAVRAGATRILPGLATAPVQRSWAGLRPITPDGRPIIGPDPAVAGIWYAVGHGRNGILLAALTGEIIGARLAGEEVDIDLEPFRVDRAFPDA
ncbi:MAG TPA: FAD-dependent oxidoreductase, partial [Gemmatimonadales bacterium]